MQSNDEQEILNETQAFAAFTEDAVRVGAFGDIQRGRAEIAAAYNKLLHQTMPGAILKQERGHVRMFSANLAVWQAGIDILLSDGTLLRGYVVQVMKKVEGRWLILEAHPKLFPSPPAVR